MRAYDWTRLALMADIENTQESSPDGHVFL